MRRIPLKTRIASGRKMNAKAGARRNSKAPTNIELAKFNKIVDELQVYKQMVDSANHSLAFADVKGNLLYVNESCARMHGYSVRELIGKHLKIFYNAEQRKRLRPDVKRLVKTGKGLNNEERWHTRRDSSVFPTLMSTYLMKDKQGRPTLLYATVVDISELKQRERELEASEKTLETMLNATSDLVVMMDRNCIIIDANQRAADRLGHPRKSLIGRRLWDFLPQKIAAARQAKVKQVLATGKTLTFTDVGRDGVIFSNSFYPLKGSSGKITGLVIFAKDVTQQKKLEEELKIYKQMVDSANHGFAILDLKGNLIYVNESLARMHGYSVGELIGNNLKIFHNPKQFKDVRAVNKRLIKTGKGLKNLEIWHIRRDGTEFPTLMNKWLLRDGSGRPSMICATAIDISALRQRESELKASKKTLETMLNATNDLVAMIDRKCTVIDVNKQMADAFEHPREKLIGRCAWDFHAPKIAAQRRVKVEQVMATGKAMTFVDGVGDGRFYSNSCYPLKDLDGKVTGMVVFSKDVTEQKKAESELRASKKILETMLNASGDAVAMLDRNIRFIEVNERMADAFGQPREKLIGRCAWGCMPPKAITLRRPKAEYILTTGKPVTYFDEDDQGRTYSTSGYPLKGLDGKVAGIVVFAKDITQHKKVEEQLSHFQEELFRLRRGSYLDLFSAVMIHHLSQPLTIINVLIEEMTRELEKGGFEKERILESLRTCLGETKVVDETIKKMRAHTRQWSEGRIEYFSPFDIISEVVSSLEPKARQAKVRIEVMKPKSLPKISWYRNAFEQIVLNLVENAIEAADQKKWHRLVISAEKTARHIELVFSDDCRGIEEKNLGKIFEPFYSTKTYRGGKSLGLGLPIVSRILAAVGGEIQVKSIAGKGTTFYVSWPLS
jgi:PAS domain S-box-containing protein